MELVTNYVIYIATWSWDCGGIYNGHFEFVIKFEVVTKPSSNVRISNKVNDYVELGGKLE
jgi:hypothetical protein